MDQRSFVRNGAWALALVLVLGAAVVLGKRLMLSDGSEGRADSGQPETPARHLVLVILDTVRADRMSAYGHTVDTTPHLGGMASEMLRYGRALAPAPWTVPSHASLFTARWPAEHRAQWGHIRLDERWLTLAEALRKRSFCTSGFSANGFIVRKTGFDRGFDALREVKGPRPTRSRRILDALPAELDAILGRDCRMFLFLNFMDAHIPYNHARYGADLGLEGEPPIPTETLKWEASAGQLELTPERLEQHRIAYDAAVRHLDDVVRELVELLRARDMLDETLLLITADHGEGLGYHREMGHSISVWEEQLVVPLLVRLPGGHRGGEVYDRPVSLVGVAPSALDWLGVPRPPELTDRPTLEQTSHMPIVADYRSYFSEGDRRWNTQMAERYPKLAATVHHRHVVYCDDHKLVVSSDGSEQLYHVTRDPHEQRDLAPSAPPELAQCRAQHRALQQQGLLTPFDAGPPRADDGIDVEMLRSLGYVE
jgi:arylsulfatase A-like enzyme